MNTSGDWTAAEHAARQALAAHADTAALAGSRLTPIDESLSNFAWHAVAGPQQQGFVRLARAGTEALGADLHAEAEILHLVSTAGIAPPVLRCDPSRRLLVTRWIEPAARAARTDDPRLIVRVAAVMAQLHGLSVQREPRRIRFDVQARLLEAALPATPTLRKLSDTAGQVFAQLAAASGALVLCHHDIHAQNMVLDASDRLWLVDWEYAGLNDPVFDLASYASQCGLSPGSLQVLCEAYAAAGGAVEEGRLGLALWAFDYVQWLWYQGLQSGANDGHGVEEASRRSERIERSLLARASGVLRCNNRAFDHND
jgi:aminoglycoside phosphotransferase (APT) family kinase protein